MALFCISFAQYKKVCSMARSTEWHAIAILKIAFSSKVI
jgi:hypothetical protein